MNVDFLRLRLDGSFGVETGDALGGYQAVLEDFNGDGFPDLALQYFGKFGVRLGSADWFAPFVELQGPGGLMAAGDFDGDGRPDLTFVVAPSNKPGDLSVSMLRGDGHGSFGAGVQSYPLPRDFNEFLLYPASLVAEDLDGDGKADLILPTYDSYSSVSGPGPTLVLHNDGDGTFNWPGTQIWKAPYDFQLASARALWRPGEASPDLIATTTTSEGCALLSYPEIWSGSVSTAVSRLIGPAPCDRSPLVVADFNGDGWPDVAMIEHGDLIVVTSDGKGGFAADTRVRGGAFTLLAAERGEGSAPASLVVMSDSRGPGLGIFPVITDVLPLRNTCRDPGSSSTRVLPWVGSAAGRSGALFESDLTLTNSGSTPTALELRYTATTGEGSGLVQHTLGPGEQLAAPSALGFLRSKGLNIPEEGNQGGRLRIHFSGLSSPYAGSAESRTESHGAGVAYSGAAPQTVAALIGPLKEDSLDRTNLVITHTGGSDSSDAMLRLVVTSTDPASPGSVTLPDVRLQPGETRQVNRILSTSGLNATSGYAFVSLSGSAAPFSVHAIVNDSVTSDGSYIPATATGDVFYRRPAAKTVVIPAVVEASDYTTELFLLNTSNFDGRFQLEIPIVSEDTGVRSLAVLLVDLPYGSARVFPDFFDELRRQGLAPPKGSPLLRHVLVTPQDGGTLYGILAGARVQNPAPGGGRYGVYLPAIDLEELPKTAATVSGLKQDDSNRTNLAITNIGDETGSEGVFKIDLYDGETGTNVNSIYGIQLAPGGFRQLNSVLAALAPETKNGWARVTRTSGSGPFIVYAVINDGARPGEGTGDGSFVLGRPEP